MDKKDNVDFDSLFNENPFNENQKNVFDKASTNDEIEILSLDEGLKTDFLHNDFTGDGFKESGDEKIEKKLNFSSLKRKAVNTSNGNYKHTITFLVVVFCVLSLWYSFFSAPLAFNAKQLISKQVSKSENNGSWDISFVNMVQGDVVGFAKELSAPSLSSTKASFYVSLGKPGDSFTYDITIKNSGTINAKVSDIIVDPENANGDAVLYYVNDINLNDELDAGKETVMHVTAKYNPEHLGPAIPVAKNVTVLVNYVQRS